MLPVTYWRQIKRSNVMPSCSIVFCKSSRYFSVCRECLIRVMVMPIIASVLTSTDIRIAIMNTNRIVIKTWIVISPFYQNRRATTIPKISFFTNKRSKHTSTRRKAPIWRLRQDGTGNLRADMLRPGLPIKNRGDKLTGSPCAWCPQILILSLLHYGLIKGLWWGIMGLSRKDWSTIEYFTFDSKVPTLCSGQSLRDSTLTRGWHFCYYTIGVPQCFKI